MLKKNVMLPLMSDITVYISICDFRTESSIIVKVSMFFWPKKIIFFTHCHVCHTYTYTFKEITIMFNLT